jgi:hypothetical protein
MGVPNPINRPEEDQSVAGWIASLYTRIDDLSWRDNKTSPASRLLKNSAAFANEARIVAIVYEEVADEPARSVDHNPSATTGGVILVVPIP